MWWEYREFVGHPLPSPCLWVIGGWGQLGKGKMVVYAPFFLFLWTSCSPSSTIRARHLAPSTA